MIERIQMRRIFVTIVCLTVIVSWDGTGFLAMAAANNSSHIRGVARVGRKPAANVVVWVDAPSPAKASERKQVLDQRNLNFYPHVLVVQVGSTVEFPNHDRVFHNVFSFHDGRRFDLGLYPTGTARRITFDKPGLSMLFCNIHPQMSAYIMAVDSAYFAVSDDKGSFTIHDVPAGTHTYHAWRSGGAMITGSAVADIATTLEVQWP
jgi:plastocyanin